MLFRSANSSYCQVCSGLSPPSFNACRAHDKKSADEGYSSAFYSPFHSRSLSLSQQILVKFLLHIVGDRLGNGAMDSVCHSLREGGDKGNVLLHIVALQERTGIVTVMDGRSSLGGATGKGCRGDPLIRKGGGVAGMNVLNGGHGDSDLIAKVGEIVDKFLLCGTNGAELDRKSVV